MNTFKQPPKRKKSYLKSKVHKNVTGEIMRGKENMNPIEFQHGRNFPTYRGISVKQGKARGPSMKLELCELTLRESRQGVKSSIPT